MADAKTPELHVEPPLPSPTEYSTITQVRAAITALDGGTFYSPALLTERMLWNPRLRGVVETRLNGLLAADVRWEPARNNRDGRRAAEAMRLDWETIAPGPVRKQFAEWCLFLGFSIGQRVPTPSPTSGRLLPVLRPYWPGWAQWGQAARRYKVQAWQRGLIDVDSPILSGPSDPSTSPWIIAEPFGSNSWRRGLIHAAFYDWFGHDRTRRASFRNSEKNGIGIIKAKFPRGTNNRGADGGSEGKHEKAIARYITGLRSMGSEGVAPLEQRGDGEPSFDIEPFEFNGQGSQAIESAMNAAAVAFAILFLGHNLTTEIKGGSFAAAGVADYIRDDVKNADAAMERAWMVPQIAEVWALWNYGDPELAPRPVYVTDSPAVNQAAATTYQQLAQALAALRPLVEAGLINVDLDAIAERFRMPMRELGKAQAQAPGADEQQDDSAERPEAQPEQDAPPRGA